MKIRWLLFLPVAATQSLAQDVKTINYTDVSGGVSLEGYLVLPAANDENMTVNRPAVVILPDANGVNEYERLRAVMIADDLGWVGFAADIYGRDLQNVTNQTQRSELLDLYRSNATLYTERIQAAVDLVASMEQVDQENIAIIGYCFGGTGVLTYALSGLGSVKAAVSFHGGLADLPVADAGSVVIPKVLVLSGGEDDMSTEIVDLESTLNAANASWEITRYSGIQHAFTVFGDDRYNQWADYRSWESMSGFLKEALGEKPFVSSQPAAVTVQDIPYTDVDGKQLQGYLSTPDSQWKKPFPTVVILPDWDGVNKYEKERATLLSSLGYAAFAADIYGVDLQDNLTMDMKMEYATSYRSNMTLFVQRINRAIEQVKLVNDVDSDNIAVIGYCLGGTGIIQLAFSGSEDVKAVVSFHGGLEELPLPTGNVTPYTLILSGGADDAHGNQTVLEEALDMVNADWEITRYSDVVHGFTSWEYSDAYSLTADFRSWESMLTTFEKLMKLPEKNESNNTVPTPEAPSSNAAPGQKRSVWVGLGFVCLALALAFS